MPEPQPRIVSRTEWNARPPDSVTPVAWSQRVGVAVHHSAGPQNQAVRSIQDFHMDTNDWSDIGYNALVGEPGWLYVGRGFDARGTHSADENTSWLAVCYIGNTNNVVPSPAALSAIRWFYEESNRRAGRTLKYSGHGQLPGEATQCPGDWLRSWVAQGMPTSGGSMELSSQLTGMEPRTVNDALTGDLQLRNWWVNPPESTGQGFPPDGSRGDILIDAALAVLDGSAVVDAEAVAEALANNEAFVQNLADRIAEQITQRPMNVSLSVSGSASGTATPVP